MKTSYKPMKIITESKNFIYREVEYSDVDSMFELDCEPDIHKYLTSYPVKNKLEVEKIIDYFRSHYKLYGIGRWAIISKQNNDFVGWVGLKFETESVMNRSHFYDLSGRIMKRFWRNGYSREVGDACVKYGFDFLKIDTIVAMSRKDNYLSNNVLKKLKFKYINQFEYNEYFFNWYELQNDKNY